MLQLKNGKWRNHKMKWTWSRMKFWNLIFRKAENALYWSHSEEITEEKEREYKTIHISTVWVWCKLNAKNLCLFAFSCWGVQRTRISSLMSRIITLTEGSFSLLIYWIWGNDWGERKRVQDYPYWYIFRFIIPLSSHHVILSQDHDIMRKVQEVSIDSII